MARVGAGTRRVSSANPGSAATPPEIWPPPARHLPAGFPPQASVLWLDLDDGLVLPSRPELRLQADECPRTPKSGRGDNRLACYGVDHDHDERRNRAWPSVHPVRCTI
jgi:hypothetical protein